MLRKALFNIIRQEQQEIETALEKEERQQAPDAARITALRQKAKNLRRELDSFPDV